MSCAGKTGKALANCKKKAKEYAKITKRYPKFNKEKDTVLVGRSKNQGASRSILLMKQKKAAINLDA